MDNRKGSGAIHCALLFLLLSWSCRAETQDWNFLAGARGGLGLDGGIREFKQVEGFGGVKLPWSWNFYSNWSLRPSLEGSAGWMEGQRQDGFVGSLGPVFEVREGKFPIALEFGTSATYLSRYVFGYRDLGDPWQFTSQIGLEWDVTKHFAVGWRFQHMSNGGIAKTNPGLNLDMFSATYTF